jgi:hypothetical protein
MKQKLLQLLLCLTKNLKFLQSLIEMIVKYIKKIIGKQKRGMRRSNLTNVVCGILYYLRTGCPWRFLPPDFGSYSTVCGWLGRLSKLNIFKNMWEKILIWCSENDILKLKHLLCDGSLAMTNSKMEIKSKNPRMKNKNCINRVLISDEKGFPLSFMLCKGTANDTNFVIPLLDEVKSKIALPKNFTVHADKGFDSIKNRWQISLREGKSEIPVRNSGYLTTYPVSRDTRRPIVEHVFAWLNSFKNIKMPSTYSLNKLYASHFLVLIVISLRFLTHKNINIIAESINASI